VFDRFDHRKACAHGACGMVALIERGVPKRHHPIAHEFVDGAFLGKHGFGQWVEQGVEQINGMGWFHVSEREVKPRISIKSTVMVRRSPSSFSALGIALQTRQDRLGQIVRKALRMNRWRWSVPTRTGHRDRAKG
jgi:hypothetical protein